jgi:exosome complex RNA-binding protein Csl4
MDFRLLYQPKKRSASINMFKKLKETLTGTRDKQEKEVVNKKEVTSEVVTEKVTEKAAEKVAEKAPEKKRQVRSSAHIGMTDAEASEAKRVARKNAAMVLTEEQQSTVMGKLVGTMKNPPQAGDLVEGPVIAVEKSSIYVDLAPFGTGIIYGREFIVARDVIKKINVGDIIAAKIVDTAHPEGYYELSLKEARQALIWSEAESAIKEKKSLDLLVKEANKGGLLMDWQGIVGFLPASQLKGEHYPKVGDGDKDKILDELKKLVGTRLTVSIITADPKEGKLIFSEKGSETKEKEKIISKYEIGDEVEGTSHRRRRLRRLRQARGRPGRLGPHLRDRLGPRRGSEGFRQSRPESEGQDHRDKGRQDLPVYEAAPPESMERSRQEICQGYGCYRRHHQVQ